MAAGCKVPQSLALLLLPLLLWSPARARPSSAAVGAGSAALPELLGPADSLRWPVPEQPDQGARLAGPDPYDEFGEPASLDWPKPRPPGSRERRLERLRRRLLWRVSRHPDLLRRQRRLERHRDQGGPMMKPHARDGRLDGPDPYSEFASAAYYRFVQAILDMRNRMAQAALSGFQDTTGVKEFFEEKHLGGGDGGNSTGTSASPSPEPTMTPSPPVQVCPPRWRLGERSKCERNATFCFKDAECPDSRCCFDGCKLRCLEPELLVTHVCKDYMNSTVIPGDLYMYTRTQLCTCDELGRPTGCKDKKPCIDVISSALFKLPFIDAKTAKLQKPKRTTRQKIYDALQEAFKHVKNI